jgi:hypothetical protein
MVGLFLFLAALMSLLGLIRGFQIGVVWTLGMDSLLSNLAPPAESIDFQRTTKQCELPQAGSTLEKRVRIGYLYVLHPSAADAKDMVMWLHVAVIARNLVQERHLARLAHFAKLLKNPMDCGQRYVGMAAPNCSADLVGARMVLRIKQRPYDSQALRGEGDAALPTSRVEFAESSN